MTPDDALNLCKFAKQAAPQQAIDQDTPAAWFVLLNDLRYEDAQQGLVRVLQRQAFVAPAEIRAEVRKMRGERLDLFRREHGALPAPPPEVAERGDEAERTWRKQAERSIADGTVTSMDQLGVRPQLPGKGRPLELENLVRSVPKDETFDPKKHRVRRKKIEEPSAVEPEEPEGQAAAK